MYSLILPVSEIPDGTTVYKPTGTKPYTLSSSIKIYGEKREIINPPAGIKYLLPAEEGETFINMVYDSAELKVMFDDLEGLEDFVNELRDIKDAQ